MYFLNFFSLSFTRRFRNQCCFNRTTSLNKQNPCRWKNSVHPGDPEFKGELRLGERRSSQDEQNGGRGYENAATQSEL